MKQQLVTLDGLSKNLLHLKNTQKINYITELTETTLFLCNSNVPVGNTVLPKYATGIAIYQYATSGDAILLAVDSTKKLYISYRNNGAWGDARII